MSAESEVLTKLPRLLYEAEKRLAWLFPSYIWGDQHRFAAALADATGSLTAVSNARLVASIGRSLRASLEFFGEPLPGDTWLLNDPFSGGTHLQEHVLHQPLFVDGHLAAFLSHVAPFADVGGKQFGGYYPQANEIWQEGIRMPPVRLRRSGKVCEDAVDFLAANTRAPELARCNVARMIRDVDLFGREVLALGADLPALGAAAIARTGDALQDFIAGLTAGSVASRAAIAHSCVGRSIEVAVQVTVRDGRLVVDLSGSSPQGDGFQNATLATTENAVACVLLSALHDCLPNSGVFSAVRVDAPEGSTVNATWPVAVGWSPYSPTAEVMVALVAAIEALGGPRLRPRLPVPPATIFRVPGCATAGCTFDRPDGPVYVYGDSRPVSL